MEALHLWFPRRQDTLANDMGKFQRLRELEIPIFGPLDVHFMFTLDSIFRSLAKALALLLST